MNRNRVIWKETFGEFRPGPGSYVVCELTLPARAEILNVERQGERFCVWFTTSISEAASTAVFTFAFVPTGGEIPSDSNLEPKYLGTVMQDEGAFVWHVFLLFKDPE